jgi:hypothetical protein
MVQGLDMGFPGGNWRKKYFGRDKPFEIKSLGDREK